MRFSTGVFMIDLFLAGLLAAAGPVFFTAVGAFLAGAVLAYLYHDKVQGEARSLYERFRKIDSQGRAEVERAFRDAERRILGKR